MPECKHQNNKYSVPADTRMTASNIRLGSHVVILQLSVGSGTSQLKETRIPESHACIR